MTTTQHSTTSTKMFTSLVPLTAVLFIATTKSSPSGPTLNDLMSFHCPSDRPFKCLPYGACCRGSEFCYSGMCESCFPRDIAGSQLLDWCRDKGQFNVTLMRNDGCRLACQDVFNATQLAYAPASEPSSLNEKINSSSLSMGRMKEMKIYEHYLITINAVLIVYLVVSLPVIFVLINIICRKRKRKQRDCLSENPRNPYDVTPSPSKQSAINLKYSLQQLENLEITVINDNKTKKENDPYILRHNSEPILFSVTDHDRKKDRALNSLVPNPYQSTLPINETPTDGTSHTPHCSPQPVSADVDINSKDEADQHRTSDENKEISGENDNEEVSVADFGDRDDIVAHETERLINT